MAFLELCNVSHRYGARHVLRNIDLSLEPGEFVAIVGASACGKSTLLKIASGLLAPGEGEVRLEGRALTEFPRDASIVFQNYSLLPWLSALENVQLAVDSAFPDWTMSRRRVQAVKYLTLVGLSAAINKRPSQLSGGMRQRVAIARSFAVEPKLLFLDEPFGALDALTRSTLQQELASLCQAQASPATALMITNSVDEAILLADRILALGGTQGASLSAAAKVEIARPRQSNLMHHDERAVRIRAQLSGFLCAERRGGSAPAGVSSVVAVEV
jgi:nitrate/nitrite transport system ATP-binding protein